MGKNALKLYEEIKNDNLSGASAILDRMIDGIGKLPPSERLKFIDLLPRTHPSMAPILLLWDRLRRFKEAGDPHGMLKEASNFIEEIRRSREKTVERGVAALSSCRRFVTISRSSLVESALIELSRARRIEVVVAESRPQNEGVGLAEALHATGRINVTLLVDVAAVYMVKDADCVVVGADAVTEKWVINKVGTFALALSAKEHQKPMFALASMDKFLDEKLSKMLKIPEREGSEVLPDATFNVLNFYFDRTPISWVTVITDI